MQANIICVDCKYFEPKDLKCLAFKGGIPNIIISGEDDHSNPLPEQDNEIVYTKIKPTSRPYGRTIPE